MILNRKNRVPELIGIIGMSIVLWLIGCGVVSVDNGGSTGTEVSALSGIVLDRNGNPVECAVVRLRPHDFLSDSSSSSAYLASHSVYDTVTSKEGKFVFDKIMPDDYAIEVVYNDTLGSFIQFNISEEQKATKLSPLVLVPPAEVTGRASIPYGSGIPIYVQVYGLEKSVKADEGGYFSIKVPCEAGGSRHRFHIGAYIIDSSKAEFDGCDLTFEVFPGEHRDAGSINLRMPPPPPCYDGSCDSAVVRFILAVTGNNQVPLESVIKTENGRIVELNLRGKNLFQGIPYDVNKLIELKVLDLGETGLPFMFPNIGRMKKLETVRLDKNMLSFFSLMVGDLVNLRELDLSGNQLSSLPPSIVNCSNMTILNVSNNRLCAIDSSLAVWLDRFDPDWRTDQRCVYQSNFPIEQ